MNDRQLVAPPVVRVTPGTAAHRELLADLGREPLAGEWWEDAESAVDADSARTSYMVVYADGPDNRPVPAAWAGWRLEADGTRLKCVDNYVRRGFRQRSPELYRLVYAARHRQVVLKLRLPAETYLFPEPIGRHLASGWQIDPAPGAAGESTPYGGGPVHRWQRLVWTPRAR
ncbi:hypothetical protein [Catenuloplanes indicus]|uniref:Uncharacterized protein n=1 Tax=Catenuloplanes indicus TaxID=137267 RepID=A0AAE3VTK3_9ACTN|nr:hypothetical protein [Catenuloplanes indicus]MDQ0363380.1 hypothetical protein [Catenuloplanes indicus]MDQ0371702.1 hypothetical protein [Catenuloplanes indicus]